MIVTAETGNIITLRLKLSEETTLSQITEQITILNGTISGIDSTNSKENDFIHDITISTSGEEHANQIIEAVSAIAGVDLINFSDRTFLIHLGGKIEINSKVAINHRDQLSMAYTPGVAKICKAIHQSPEKAWQLTIKRNTIAIVSDGSAVLGLGNIGPEAAMPVMEGKAMLFKDFAGVDAFPICLDTQDSEEIIKAVKQLAPGFGGVNLEDIAAPRCFEIEERLKAELDIPVFHDDQHGTAIVIAAGFINALRLTKQKAQNLKVVFSGVGAAGVACTKMLQQMGVENIIGCDRNGALHSGRGDLNEIKKYYAETTNPNNEMGSLAEALKGADVFIGLSGPNLLSVEDIQQMNAKPIIFALANPVPEIMPELVRPYASIVATGRSDYPNQVNNALAFPGLFRGVLDCQASAINEEMKLAAAYAIANTIEENALSPDYIIPSIFDEKVVPAVAQAVRQSAQETGVARKES
ncbi:MAG: NAD-dependent malic enzyme [Gammaproteobacteria bacterium]|nr:NAD-dependent malic enzyme [Gammaproteobacteria bacterium]